jgi:hypothetical protein
VTALSLEARAADQASVDDFEVVYVTEGGAERTLPLTAAWAVAFECGCPVRRLRSRKGQRHLSGLWWSATTGGHVDFESWLERDHVMALDFDAAMVGIASQPFWLRWADERGWRVSHAPDFFARRADGSWWSTSPAPTTDAGSWEAANSKAGCSGVNRCRCAVTHSRCSEPALHYSRTPNRAGERLR